MSSRLFPSRLLGNLVALVAAVLVGAFLFDLAAEWLGYNPLAFCMMHRPILSIAYGVGITSVGVIIWGASMGKSEAGIDLALGGVMLFILPLVLPRYLGAECIP